VIACPDGKATRVETEPRSSTAQVIDANATGSDRLVQKERPCPAVAALWDLNDKKKPVCDLSVTFFVEPDSKNIV
jgi:hypothetical protein